MNRLRTNAAAFVLGLLAFPAATALADGGALIASEVAGPHQVSIFMDPPAPRAGFVDVSVFVQDPKTNQPITDAEITITVRPLASDSAEQRIAWVPPCCSMEESLPGTAVLASHSAAQNKFLQAANIFIPTSGDFELLTSVKTALGTAQVPARITAQPPAPPFVAYWPFLAFPPLLITLFSLRERILSSKATPPPSPTQSSQDRKTGERW